MKHDDKSFHYLLVEDEPDHAQLVQYAFKATGSNANITHVADGEAAIAYLRKEAPYENAIRPNLILLDLKLPKLDGHQVLDIIKSDINLAKIPVIILSTSDASDDLSKAYGAYANSFIIKPLDFEAYKDIVTSIRDYWGRINVSAA